MLRSLFGIPKRNDEGELLEALQSIKKWMNWISGNIQDGDRKHKFKIRCRMFLVALDEIEQSLFAAEKCAMKINKRFTDEMSPEESDEYYRYVYFYKNGFIRVFSILDKLGFFLNDLLGLKTESAKHNFSYFTVLRQMRGHARHGRFQQELYDLKESVKEPLGRLRKQRNMETHSFNAESIDDMLLTSPDLFSHVHVEDIRQNLGDLRQGLVLVCQSVSLTFKYVLKLSQKGELPLQAP